MVKAHIQTKDGTKIEIDGTTDELNKIIGLYAANPIKANSDPTININNIGKSDWLLKLAKDSGTTEEKLKTIIDPDGQGRLISHTIKGNNESEKQFNAVLCLGTIRYYSSGDNILDTMYLHKELEWLGIGSLVNLPTNLKNRRPHIISDTKQGSKSSRYKISQVGVTDGLKLLKEMCA